jgi:hypothetical protein
VIGPPQLGGRPDGLTVAAVRAGHRVGAGLRKTSWKKAINKSNGLFNKGCHYSFKVGRPVCTTKSKRAA